MDDLGALVPLPGTNLDGIEGSHIPGGCHAARYGGGVEYQIGKEERLSPGQAAIQYTVHVLGGFPLGSEAGTGHDRDALGARRQDVRDSRVIGSEPGGSEEKAGEPVHAAELA